jgi:hypothetical protein
MPRHSSRNWIGLRSLIRPLPRTGEIHRKADVLKKWVHGRRLADEGDDGHLGTAHRAGPWEGLMDARQQHCPRIDRQHALVVLAMRLG